MKRILFTGFEAFGGYENPTEAACTELGTCDEVFSCLLPVSYQRAPEVLAKAIEDHRPDIIVLSGVAKGRKSFSFESTAYNIMDSDHPDNDGCTMTARLIELGAPEKLASSMDIEGLFTLVQAMEYPVEISTDPGRYLCNLVYFKAIQSGIPCVFVHVPAKEDMPVSDSILVLKAICLVLQSSVIGVSDCLTGTPCRYSSDGFDLPAIRRLENHFTVIRVCPESLIGTPRLPSEIRGDRVVNSEGTDVTEQFLEGAEKCTATLRESGAKVAILKEKSPSCGVFRVYDGFFTSHIIEGSGIMAQKLNASGILCIPVLK